MGSSKHQRRSLAIGWAIGMVVGMLLANSGWAARPAVTAADVNLSSTLTRQPNESRGQRIYEMHCQRCHQADASGSAAQKVPALAGQQYEYLVKQVVDILDFERASNAMHQQLVNSGINNATSIADVIGYVANLPRNPVPQVGPGVAVAQGKAIYEGYCASCHGPTAEGNGSLWVPSLRGQHYSYLVEQMQRMASAQRANISEDLHRMFVAYSGEEYQAVADYLGRWGSAQ